MTKKHDLKEFVRARMQKTGESYTAALRNVRRPTAAQSGETFRESRAPVFVSDLLEFLRDDRTTLVPKDAPEFGPYATLHIVPGATLHAALATGRWREVTAAEMEYAMDLVCSFEDYGSEHEFFC